MAAVGRWARLEGPTATVMAPTTQERPASLLVTTMASGAAEPPASASSQESRGFGGGAAKASRRKGAKKRSPALSKADWGPLGKHPDLEAIVARQCLHLPRCGRLAATDVTRAWKTAAAEHHPDRGGDHDTMQRVNAARDLLLGRGEA